MAEVRPPSVRSVKAALRNAGLTEAATSGTGRDKTVVVAGFRTWTLAGEVRVTHWTKTIPAGFDTAQTWVRQRDEQFRKLGAYAEVLTAAGWRVVDASQPNQPGYLAVLAGPAKERQE
jgi:hypothetical protein